jgi:DNA-binding transcriptional LysR family regulator
LEIRHVRAFVTVADVHSVRKAADRLHVASSALSRTIHDLERELGVPLLERSAHGTRLTEAGARFLNGARRILVEVDAATTRARDARASTGGPLVVGIVNPELWPTLIQAVLRRYRKAMPNVVIHLVPLRSSAIAASTAEGSIDVGIGYAVAPNHGIVVRTVVEDVLAGVIMARAHPLAGRRKVSLFDLERYPFLCSGRGETPGMVDLIFAKFRMLGFTPHCVPAFHRIGANAAAAFALVGSGVGWTLFPTGARSVLPKTLRYARLTDLSIPLPLDLVMRAEDRSLRARAFGRILEELSDERHGERVRARASL